MHRSRHTWILLAVATLVVGVAAPAAAKKGGHPGAPSGTGLEVTVEPTSVFMWANSIGDKIDFDITVTNSSGVDLNIMVVFDAIHGEDRTWGPFPLLKNNSWTEVLSYIVVGTIETDDNGDKYFTGDLADLPPSQSLATVGTVTAWVEGGPSDSAPVEMTAAPIPPCDDPAEDGSFSFTTSDDYSVCAFKGSGDWVTITTLNRPSRGKSHSPSATIRDGVPGNWCNDGEAVVDDTGRYVTSYWYFPPDDGTCLNGGAGGDTIPVRNEDTFYLATWRGNEVYASPYSSGG